MKIIEEKPDKDEKNHDFCTRAAGGSMEWGSPPK